MLIRTRALCVVLVLLGTALGSGCGDASEEPVELDADVDMPDAGDEPDTIEEPECTEGEVEDCVVIGTCGGTRVCENGEWMACVAPAEVCDGLDNDCDGEVDEDFAELGEGCVRGEGQCEISGEMVCGADGQSVVCSVEAGQGNDEVCDGIDNDCNGVVDDVPGVGESCDVGTGTCAVSGTQICDTDAGALVCDASAGSPEVEVCDVLDNDCNGIIDDVEGLGDGCSVGSGTCAASGSRVCDNDAGALVCDATPGSPQTETCNGLDDDCDGTPDNVEGLGDACSVGVGACASTGARICDSETGGLVCGATPGSPQTETCNGIDDDCDGVVDNVAGLGQACSVGTGECSASGTRVCNTNAGALVCNAVAGSPQTEVCDGLDNNCNGTVDDVAGLGGSCSVGEGACAASGERVCDLQAGTLLCDATPGSPQTETCNGVDDNCDGTPDNVAGLGNSCSVGVGACQRNGSRICNTNTESLTCSVSAGSPSAESCNGVDDNCDGIVDNTTLSFAAATTFGADRGCVAMATGDLNGDGREDIVCAPTLSAAVNPDTRLYTYLNQGSGGFASPTYLQAVAVAPFRAQSSVALGDVNGDGDLDIVAVGETMKAQVYLNNGSGQFAAPYEAFDFSAAGEPGTGGLVLADFDGDGDLDIATTFGSIRFGSDWDLAISRNNGSGGFGIPMLIGTAGPIAKALFSLDLQSDGDQDLIAVYADHVRLFRATSPGVFAAPSTVLSGAASLGSDPLLGDLNNDGFADLLLPASGTRYFVPGTSSGFGSATSATVSATEVSAAAGQFDCDAAAEVMVVASNSGAPLYYLGTPPNLSGQSVVSGQDGSVVRVFDVDHDGDDDVVVGSQTSGIRVLRRQ